jgi:cyclic 2,3-diphosphoglycerate synthetase
MTLPPHLVDLGGKDGATAIALVDGEHYPQVVADAIAALSETGWTVRMAALVGGTEKLRGEPDYGVPHVSGVGPEDALFLAREALVESANGSGPLETRWVIDLADEPVMVLERRLRMIAVAASAGMGYVGPDTVVRPPTFGRIDAPTLSVIGTGKRIGKTAISAHLARLADRELTGQVVVVAMGRGGPADPVVVDRSAGPVTVEQLLEISRSGKHAASDYLEDAVLAGVTTVGCRRAGGGILGVPMDSNVFRGAQLADELEPSLVLLEGSGSCIPPVRADRAVLVASTARPEDLLSGTGAFRVAMGDLVLVVGDDRNDAEQLALACGHPNSVAVRLEATIQGDLSGRKVGVFTTAPEHAGETIAAAIVRQGAEPVIVSHALAKRDELRTDIARAIELGADCLLTEVKAAAIDVVAEAADAAGLEVAFLDNRPVAHDPEIDIDERLLELCRAIADE